MINRRAFFGVATLGGTVPVGVAQAVQVASDLRRRPGLQDGEMLDIPHIHGAGDAAGGRFFWQAQSFEPDDGGMVFAPFVHRAGRWVRQSHAPVNVLWFGAQGDGVTDDLASFQRAWDYVGRSGAAAMLVPPRRYHLSAPIVFGGGRDFVPSRIDAYGAVFDNTVVIAGFRMSIAGMTVKRAPGEGFVFMRGQGAYHQALTAIECGGAGFLAGAIGTSGRQYGQNSQVTRAQFDSLLAKGNAGPGWAVTGTAFQNRSWFNANQVNNFSAIGNRGEGFITVPGHGPKKGSTMNYNIFTNLNCEGNARISLRLDIGRQNTFLGGHLVDKDENGYCVVFSQKGNLIYGGRYVGDVTMHGTFGIFNSAGRAQRGTTSQFPPNL